MRRWPWVTVVVAALALFSPPGRTVLYGAFLSNEQLSRNIALPFAIGGIAILVLAGLLEWWMRRRYL